MNICLASIYRVTFYFDITTEISFKKGVEFGIYKCKQPWACLQYYYIVSWK